MSFRFWPVIDLALREAACTRGVEVKLLVSCWSHSPGAMFVFLQSLSVLNKPPLSCNIYAVRFCVLFTSSECLFFHPAGGLMSKMFYFTESFWGALNTRAAEDPVCTRQPCQVHGDWSSCLHRCVHVPISQHDLTCMLFHIPATWRQVWRCIVKTLPTETVNVYICYRIAVNMSFGIKRMSVS